MSNKLFYEAVFRDALPIFEKFAYLGWPEKLYPWFLAQAQLPDADTAAQRAFTLHMGDCISNGTLPAQKQQVAWADNKLIEPHIAPADFAAWLQREGIEPSPLIREWLTHYGIAYAGTNRPGATHTATSAAVIRHADAAAPASATTYKRMTEADLLDRMPLQQNINVPYAAQILGLDIRQVLAWINQDDLKCWSHSANWDVYTVHPNGDRTLRPRLTPETDPFEVEVASADVLKSWCMAMEAFPEDSVEDVSARALKRYNALIEKARQGPGAASTAVIRLEDVDSFERLCQYRQQFAHLESQKRPHWKPQEREILLKQHEDGMSIADMPRAFGHASEGSIKNQLARAKKECEKAQDAAAPANQNPPQNPFQMLAKTRATP